MDFGQVLVSINYWAVLVSAFSAFVVGWIWYGPLFGKLWMKLNGFTEEEMKEGTLPMSVMMGVNYIATFLAAFAIAIFIGEEASAGFGVLVGVVIAIFWIGTNRINDVLYERKALGLYFINVGYNLIVYAIMGGILGLWP